jgi:hypothetical protein
MSKLPYSVALDVLTEFGGYDDNQLHEVYHDDKLSMIESDYGSVYYLTMEPLPDYELRHKRYLSNRIRYIYDGAVYNPITVLIYGSKDNQG